MNNWNSCLRRSGWILLQSGFPRSTGSCPREAAVTTTTKTFQLPKSAFFYQSAIPSVRWYSTQNDKTNENVSKQDSTNETSGQSNTGNQNTQLSSKDRLKIITTQYGAFGMAFHITISLASLGLFYSLVYMGVDMASLFQFFGMESSSFTTGASTFMIAYAVHKIFAPVRIGITFVSVPVLVKYFRKIGIFKRK